MRKRLDITVRAFAKVVNTIDNVILVLKGSQGYDDAWDLCEIFYNETLRNPKEYIQFLNFLGKYSKLLFVTRTGYNSL